MLNLNEMTDKMAEDLYNAVSGLPVEDASPQKPGNKAGRRPGRSLQRIPGRWGRLGSLLFSCALLGLAFLLLPKMKSRDAAIPASENPTPDQGER